VALAGALAAAGCTSTIYGTPPDNDVASDCQAAPAAPAVAAMWNASDGACSGALVGSRTVVTAASCVAGAVADGKPIVLVLGELQYIGQETAVHPGFGAADGLPSDDLALVSTTQPVAGVEALGLDGGEPAAAQAVTVVGYGDWRPDDAVDPGLHAGTGAVDVADDRGFTYTADAGGDGCLDGAGGGLVLAGGDAGALLGVVGVEGQAARVDHYACWIACASALDVPGLPLGCDCTMADQRACNQCGAEYLDATTEMWSACAAAPDLYPCATGTCQPDGTCL
jgi:hypothetical protein